MGKMLENVVPKQNLSGKLFQFWRIFFTFWIIFFLLLGQPLLDKSEADWPLYKHKNQSSSVPKNIPVIGPKNLKNLQKWEILTKSQHFDRLRTGGFLSPNEKVKYSWWPTYPKDWEKMGTGCIFYIFNVGTHHLRKY